MIYAKEVEEITQFALDKSIEIENKIDEGEFSNRELMYILEDIDDTFMNTVNFIKEKIKEAK